jgi:hypothetical protein
MTALIIRHNILLRKKEGVLMPQQYNFDNLIDYRIEVAGHFDMNLPECLDEKTVSIISDFSNGNVTTLTGTYDQAGLLGLLRCLYYLGLPIVSVNKIKSEENQKGEV